MNVKTILTNTVFFLPIRFISMAAGIDRMKNQINTMEGRNPAWVSVHPNCSLAYVTDIPTKSQNPIMKKPKRTGNNLEIEFCDMIFFYLIQVSMLVFTKTTQNKAIFFNYQKKNGKFFINVVSLFDKKLSKENANDTKYAN